MLASNAKEFPSKGHQETNQQKTFNALHCTGILFKLASNANECHRGDKKIVFHWGCGMCGEEEMSGFSLRFSFVRRMLLRCFFFFFFFLFFYPPFVVFTCYPCDSSRKLNSALCCCVPCHTWDVSGRLLAPFIGSSQDMNG